MQNDPRGPTEMRALRTIGGVIVFGTPIFAILAGFLGVAVASVITILLAAASFVTIRRNFKHYRIENPPANQPYRSTGTTRYWPQKYNKRERKSYNAAVNRHRKPEPTRLQRNLLKVLRFALKPLRSVRYIISNRMEGDIKKDELLHRQTRNTPWW